MRRARPAHLAHPMALMDAIILTAALSVLPTYADDAGGSATRPKRTEAAEGKVGRGRNRRPVALATLVRKADVIVVGKVAGTQPAKLEHRKALLVKLGFQALLPRYANAVLSVRATQFLKSDRPDTKKIIEVHRISGLTLATENIEKHSPRSGKTAGVWILNRDAERGILWASAAEAFQPLERVELIRKLVKEEPAEGRPRAEDSPTKLGAFRPYVAKNGLGAVPFLREKLRGGSPREKYEVLRIFVDYGVIPLIPDVIQAVTDLTPIPGQADVIPGEVGHQASFALATYARLLDGVRLETRGVDQYSLLRARPGDMRERAQTVQANWLKWWRNYRGRREDQPDKPSAHEPGKDPRAFLAENLKDADIPLPLLRAYARFVSSAKHGVIPPLSLYLPSSISFSIRPRTGKGFPAMGDVNIPFLQKGFSPRIIRFSKFPKYGDGCYLLRTGTTALWFVETKSMGWRLYAYIDRPIK